MKKLRVQKGNDIVCYDAQGFFSVTRAAWMMRYFGATSVRVLDGGLKKWNAEGRKLVGGAQTKHGESSSEVEGDYSYVVAQPSKAITDIKEMHDVARTLYNTDSQGPV